MNFGTDSDFVREIENMCSSFVPGHMTPHDHDDDDDDDDHHHPPPPPHGKKDASCWAPTTPTHRYLFGLNVVLDMLRLATSCMWRAK